VTGAVPHVLLGSGEGCIMALGFKSPGTACRPSWARFQPGTAAVC